MGRYRGAGSINYKWTAGGALDGTSELIFAYVSKDAVALDNPLYPPGLLDGDVPTESGNWFLALNLEQYLWQPEKTAGKHGLVRTRAFDYQAPGIGAFFRIGFSPEDRNLWNLSLNTGFSGRGMIPGRPYDRAGIGAYAMLESEDLQDQAKIGEVLGTEIGAEAFYNFAITPWLQLSADIQWVKPGIRSRDNTVVIGTRLFTQF